MITRPPEPPARGRRSARHARRRSTLRRRIVVFVGVLALAMTLSAVAWAGITYWYLSEQIKPPEEDAEAIAAALTPRAEEPEEVQEPLWVLLLGSDARPGEKGARADTIILARLDPEDRTVMLLSVPRDTRVQIPGRGTNKINAATAYGGSALMIRSVQELTGLPIDHYVKIDFEGFRKGVDAMGGIRIDVERSINDPKASDYVMSAARVPAGPQVLDGARALTYVRSRAYPDGDFTRIRNQQNFIIEFIRQALDPAKITQLPAVASSIASHLDTDMSVRELLDLAQVFKGLRHDGVQGYTVPSSTANIGGVSYVIPDERALSELAEAFRQGEPPAAFDEVDMFDFNVAVVNATEVPGAAARLGSRLERLGFSVETLVSDPTEPRYSMVLYRQAEHVEEARLVAHALGDWAVVRDSSGLSRHSDVVVVIGNGRVNDARRHFREF